MIKSILWWLFGYDSSIFDNRFMYHVAGGVLISHLFFFVSPVVSCSVVGICKELMDHFVFGCGGNEIKHLTDFLGWNVGAVLYLLMNKVRNK